MYLNPIVKKDVKVQSRSMKICWGVFAYELILALVYFLAMSVIQNTRMYSTANIYSYIVWLYPVLAVTQLVILGMVVPVRTASSISGEKERQTFDIMMTTSMSPFSIILGKVMTAIVQSMFYVVASMPIMALPFIIGGMSWAYLFLFLGIAILVALFSASIGIFCSSLCKKSISAVILSYVFYLVFFLGTAVPPLVYSVILSNMRYNLPYNLPSVPQIYVSIEPNFYLSLLLNPAVYLVEFFSRVMAGESVVNTLASINGGTKNIGPINLVATGNRWMILSTILFVGISLLFLWLASKLINPIKGRKKRGSHR